MTSGATSQRGGVRLAALHGVAPLLDDHIEKELKVDRFLLGSKYEFRMWLRVALTHYSYHFEHPEEYPGVSRETLDLLRSAGEQSLRLNMLRCVILDSPESNLNYRHERGTRLEGAVRVAIAERLMLENRAIVSAGLLLEEVRRFEERRIHKPLGPGAPMFEAVVFQILGLLSLYRLDSVFDEIVRNAYNTAKIALRHALNYDDLFERHLTQKYKHRDGLRLDAEQQGPDHNATFTAQAITPDGKSGTGYGTSKREALRDAKRDYLSKHRLDLLREPEAGKLVMPPSDSALPRESAEAAAALARLFGVDPDNRFFRQALVHTTWLNENLRGAKVDHSNATLANLGSFVINDLIARVSVSAWLQHTARPDPELLDMANASANSIAPLFTGLQLEGKVLVGRSLRGPLNPRLSTDAVQAIFGAAYIAHGLNSFKLEEQLPRTVRRWLVDIAVSVRTEPFSAVERHLFYLGLVYHEDVAVSGPDHKQIHKCVASVYSPALGESIQLRGEASSQRIARKLAVAPLVPILVQNLGWVQSSWWAEALEEATREHLVSFILRHQLAALPTSDLGRLRWIQNGYLGAGLLTRGDIRGFRRWSEQAIRHMQHVDRNSAAANSLRVYYAQSIDQQVKQSDAFTKALVRVISWVRQCANEAPRRYTDDSGWHDLLALCAAQRVRLTDQQARPLRSALEDWLVLHRRRLSSDIRADLDHNITAPGVVAAGVTQCLTELAPHLPTSGVRIVARQTSESSAEIDLFAQSSWVPVDPAPMIIRLVCEVTSQIRYSSSPERARFEVELIPAGRSNLLDSLADTRSSSEVDGEIARSLHDLKNELYAAQVAADQPVFDLDRAKLHLAEAGRLARRLAGMSSMYVGARIAPILLDVFFDSYVREKMESLPAGILFTPPMPQTVTVLGNVTLLRTAVDNLVNNAVEAMPNGGIIGFEYAADPTQRLAQLKISDTGPGISHDVLAAVENGHAPVSTKRQGTGLGLVSTRQYVRRMGGSLYPAKTGLGHAWAVTLPLANTDSTSQ